MGSSARTLWMAFSNPRSFIRQDKALDAATGDEVLVRVTREATQIKDAAGEIVRVLERATRTFVGTYFERDGEAFVRVDIRRAVCRRSYRTPVRCSPGSPVCGWSSR